MTKIVNTTKTLKINGKEVEIKKMPLEKIIEAMEEVQSIPENFMKIKPDTKDEQGRLTISNKRMLESLPALVVSSIKELIKPLAKACNGTITEEFLKKECGMADIMEIVYVLIEVNEVEKTLEMLKKIQGVGGMKMLRGIAKK
jgi:hypothetical protein